MKRVHYSKQRELILDYFNSASQALSGEEVFYALKENVSEISRSTVFRNLNFLVKQGQLTRIATPKGPALYELANNKMYAICEICGKNIGINIDTNLEKDIDIIIKEVYNKTNILSAISGVTFLGICNQCAKILKRKKRNE